MTATLAVDLEFQRLAHRAHRVEQVLVALHERRGEHADEAVPPGLHRAIHDFSSQLDRTLADLQGAPSAADRPHPSPFSAARGAGAIGSETTRPWARRLAGSAARAAMTSASTEAPSGRR